MSELYPMLSLSDTDDDEKIASAEIGRQVLCAIQNGATFQEIYGIPDHIMDTLYACAYDFYQKGRIDDAEVFFQFLCTHNVYNADYILGLAAVHHRQKNYSKAVRYYELSFLINNNNYPALFYAGQCYLNLKDAQQARACFAKVVGSSGASDLMTKQARSYLLAIKPENNRGETND